MDDVEWATEAVEDELDDELDPLVLSIVPANGAGAQKSAANPTKVLEPTHHRINQEELSTYIYPTNLQVRDYQYNIVLRAFFHNTLVVLPTGLGKTFIASTVILNFFRWFPDLKIVFMAPTKPLVAQQIKACCGITGLLPLTIAILLDLSRKNRASIWEEKRVFFTTPQVVENDLKLGTVSPKLISLLVIDEAHRAKGNYAYNNVVKSMDRFNPSYRILAMTATPASTVEGVQEIIDNLHISKAEVRTENSIDICRYLKQKTIERFHIEPSDDIRYAIESISTAIAPILKQANDKGYYDVRDPARINFFTALDASRRLVANKSISEGQKWAGHALLQVLSVAGQCFRRLNIYGIRSFYSYFKDKYYEAEKKALKLKKPTRASVFYQHPEMKKLMQFCEARVKDASYLGHGKLELVVSQVEEFFSTTQNSDSRVIIFSEFRESALDIVRAIERLDGRMKPHIFIGQSREKSEETKLGGNKKKRTRKEINEEGDEMGQTSSEIAQTTGMSQKMQKETIRKFKSGEFNVLVATSIGEEGLDIGEVDLIVCYDSTSSPIKNIQRMGRTGRNRDGKILLLFSSNEESKFDKAMSGYEYIQQHIMNGKLIQLHDQNRIIPAAFTPTAEKRFIEIPEENTAIKEEADDDEIIKIATKYMTGGKPTTKSKVPSKLPKGQTKLEKRFFMPDNVETGFKLASSLLQDCEKTDQAPLAKKAKKAKKAKVGKNNVSSPDQAPDILDLILDSDTEQPVQIEENGRPSELELETENERKTSRERNPASLNRPYVPSKSPKTSQESASQKVKASRQPQLDSLISQNKTRKISPLLGIRKRLPRSADQSSLASGPSSEDTGSISIVISDEDEEEEEVGEDEKGAKKGGQEKCDEDNNVGDKSGYDHHDGNYVKDDFEDDGFDDDFDVFDDDDEILALAKRTQSGENSTPSFLAPSLNNGADIASKPPSLNHPDIASATSSNESSNENVFAHHPAQTLKNTSTESWAYNPDEIYSPNDTSEVLTASERDDLYTNYYVAVDAYGLEKCAIPQTPLGGVQLEFQSAFSKRFLRAQKIIETMTDKDARAQGERYKRDARRGMSAMKKVVEFQ